MVRYLHYPREDRPFFFIRFFQPSPRDAGSFFFRPRSNPGLFFVMAQIKTFLFWLGRVLIGDDGTDRHGTLAGIWDALGFFVMLGIVCGLVSIYAAITGVW